MWFSVVCILIDNEYASSQWSKCCGLTRRSLLSRPRELILLMARFNRFLFLIEQELKRTTRTKLITGENNEKLQSCFFSYVLEWYVVMIIFTFEL